MATHQVGGGGACAWAFRRSHDSKGAQRGCVREQGWCRGCPACLAPAVYRPVTRRRARSPRRRHSPSFISQPGRWPRRIRPERTRLEKARFIETRSDLGSVVAQMEGGAGRPEAETLLVRRPPGVLAAAPSVEQNPHGLPWDSAETFIKVRLSRAGRSSALAPAVPACRLPRPLMDLTTKTRHAEPQTSWDAHSSRGFICRTAACLAAGHTRVICSGNTII